LSQDEGEDEGTQDQVRSAFNTINWQQVLLNKHEAKVTHEYQPVQGGN